MNDARGTVGESGEERREAEGETTCFSFHINFFCHKIAGSFFV
jgi:hypothetical protein